MQRFCLGDSDKDPGSIAVREAELGIKAIGREVVEADGVYELRERNVSYKPNFASENIALRPENSCFWNLSI